MEFHWGHGGTVPGVGLRGRRPTSGSRAEFPQDSQSDISWFALFLCALCASGVKPASLQGSVPGLACGAWIRLSGGRDLVFRNRAHFFGAAAEAMLRILIEHARRRLAAKQWWA